MANTYFYYLPQDGFFTIKMLLKYDFVFVGHRNAGLLQILLSLLDFQCSDFRRITELIEQLLKIHRRDQKQLIKRRRHGALIVDPRLLCTNFRRFGCFWDQANEL